jgi:NAD(P)-dependent dehydrogenase (short-subunit alcohol dehydrogenase family)
VEANKIIITGAATRVGAAIAMKLAGPNKEIVIHYNKSKHKRKISKKI